ncbi:hypothetical protein [Agreia sp. Leaf283]|uniref:hypothetical protein n=1 Tax=Agreia sp. Leaf283 TaxID=1736321 RepID=UPI0006FC3049|nr:hypothetical protein [Agreia sp. Leaf283]KQP53981.1 hypothetical protein ASF51_17810 [Agreia sp. Leaf283]
MPAPTDDTVRIGRHPGIQNLRLIAEASLSVAAALGAPASLLFSTLGAGEGSWPLGVLSVWLVFGGGIAIGVTLAYAVIEFSPGESTASMRRGTLSFRRRTVPLDTITEAWRSVSSAPNGTGYKVYRFTSTDGATSRVLVRGHPMKGLDAQGLRSLAAFVGGLPLEVPDAAARPARIGDGREAAGPPALTERQRAAAVSLTEGGGKSRVGRETLLIELQGLIDAAEAADSRYPSGADGTTESRESAAAATRRPRGGIRALIALVKADRLERAREDDDAEATDLLASHLARTGRLRRLLLRLLIGCIGVGVGVVAVSIVLDAISSRILNATGEDVVLLVVASAILLSIALVLGWCAAADADVRSRRDLARRWMALRDGGERKRGMPTPFLLAWTEQAWRLRSAGAGIWSVVGAVMIIIGIVALVDSELPLFTRIGILVSGLALVGIGVAMFMSVTRRRRAEAEEMVYLGGGRLLPPDGLS